jgi:hypothetical protein
MANQLYPKAKEDFLSGNLNMSSNTVTIALIDTGVYTFSSAHEDRADIGNTAVIATANLASKTITSGVFDAADATFTSVTGANCEALILYHNTGDAENDGARQADSRLIAFIDTATGLPILPNGGDITVRFSDGASKIFAL